ncbi:MAG: D-alanine--D-alanine ligase [Candidatus Magnetoglobus multicellularis str. Araruama]|uniref:D-alanine--D-alanine ligase n=1 Tax=Candidatus Magnetoglobus multicellularis str. Araruama TaxID=890399 RepID=A0A1V1P8P0_9BACT|nr:MAG: D-alanine--D-alanine ligase [Candidatus Magnetoglobus multicellularis str. Araruama]
MKIAVIYNHLEIEDSDVINIFGAQNKERYNPKTVEKVATALEKGGHNVRVLKGNMHIIESLQQFMPKVVSGELPGMVFNMAYGIQGQSRYTHIPAMLEMVGIPYVGSGPDGHTIALDKVLSKMIFQRNHLPTPAFWIFSKPDEDCSNVVYPVIVKPKMEAVSFGLRVVDNAKDLKSAIEFTIKEFNQQALVESFIPGREFAVGLLGNGPNLEVLPIVEIDLSGDPNAIQSIEDKMVHPREKICPPDLPEALSDAMNQLAIQAFNSLGLHDFARVDIRMNQNNELFLLEINSMASLGMTGTYVHSAKTKGYTYSSLVNRMLDVAAFRYFGDSLIQNETNENDAFPKKKSEPLHFRLRSYIRSQLSTIQDYLEQMVRINTNVNNVEGLNTLGNWISTRFNHLGFHRQSFPQSEVGNVLYFSNHLKDTNDILILGHLDTKYDFDTYVPFHEERGRIIGSGVAESKGGIAIILGAIQALRFTRSLKNIRCGILLTADDSIGGRFSKKLIAELAQHAKCVINTKYGDMNGGIVTGCAGTREYQILLSNIKSLKKTKEPKDIITFITKKVTAWQKMTSEEKGLFVKVVKLNAWATEGISSDHASVTLFVRFNEKNKSKEIDQQIINIAEKNTGSDFQVQIKRSFRRLPVHESDINLKLYHSIKKIADQLEIRISSTHRNSSSDICHVPEQIPALDGFGPIGGDCQSPNEYIIRDSLIDRSALLALIIHKSAKFSFGEK